MQTEISHDAKVLEAKSTPIKSITSGPRQSNIELLRIVAMLLVLVVHADFLSLGRPSSADFVAAPAGSLSRMFFQALSIICVNVFVLISGWFTIKPSLKGLCNFLFQCLFISNVIAITGYLCGAYDNGIPRLVFQNIFLKYSGYWFIKAYIILYIVSPVLNAFAQNASKQQMLYFLICFYLLQTVWSSIEYIDVPYYSKGFSPLSFIGLYLLAQTIRRHYSGFTMKTACRVFCISLGIIFASTSIVFGLGISKYIPIYFWAYSNPIVVAESLGLLMIFVRIRLKPHKIINWISASAFAVYLFHINPVIFDRYQAAVQTIYRNTESVVTLLAILGFICCVFMSGIILDQARKFLWRMICIVVNFDAKLPFFLGGGR